MFPMGLGISSCCGLLCTIGAHAFPMIVHMTASFPHQQASYPHFVDNFGDNWRINGDNAKSRTEFSCMALDIVGMPRGRYVEKLLITRWKTSG